MPEIEKGAFLAAINSEVLRMGKTKVSVSIELRDLLPLIASVQLASRHPHKGPTIRIAEDICRQLAEGAYKEYPAHQRMVGMGWNPRFDISL